jgi:acyl-CoA thioesterase FadM
LSTEAHPFEFRVTEDYPVGVERDTLLYPDAVENACWQSFIASGTTNEVVNSGDVDIDYIAIRHRCEHLVPGYPCGEVLVKMQVLQLEADHATLLFEHLVENPSATAVVARSETTMACVRKFGARSLPSEWPESIRKRLVGLRKAERAPSQGRRRRLLGWLVHFRSRRK